MRLKIISVCLVLAMQMGSGTAQAENYPLGQFNVTSGFAMFGDGFGDGVEPPSGPWGAASYWGIHGSFPDGVETGGALLLDPVANGAPVGGFPGRKSVAASAPFWNQAGTSFVLSGVFALKTPVAGNHYGLNTHQYTWNGTEFVSANLGLLLRVTNAGGSPFVQLTSNDYSTGVSTTLNSLAISTSAHDGLGLLLAYDGSGPIQAYYQYFDGASPVGSSPTAVGSTAYGGDARLLGFYASAPVPEPETYAMLLAGLGLLGFIARRRRAS